MNYYYDLEFLEGTQERPLTLKSRLGHWMIGKQKPTIDLISIGIVSDDDREYYAISKDFNLKEAWNRYDEKVEIMYGDMRNRFPEGRKYKEYWIRENVLRPIWKELSKRYMDETDEMYESFVYSRLKAQQFSYGTMKFLINRYGKSNKQIADGIKEFAYRGCDWNYPNKENEINLYGYYSAYDHVALCWLFGKMIDLPSGFPMYTRDLKQMLDEKAESMSSEELSKIEYPSSVHNVLSFLATRPEFNPTKHLKTHKDYPKETNSHNALADAYWNKQLRQFIQSL